MSPPDRVRLGTRERLVLFALVLITFVGSLDSTILATALPTIARELGDLQHLAWVVTAYLLAVTSSALIWGKLGDLFGRKRVLQTALVVFLLGSVLCSQSDDLIELVGYRSLQGIGGGGLLVVPQAVLTDLVGPRDRGRYQVYVAGAAATACVLGPLAGGLLVEHGTWRWAFYVNLPVGLTVIAILAFTLRPHRAAERPRIDYWGSLLIAACAAGLTLLVTWGGTAFAWSSPTMLVLFGTTAVLMVLIWRVERSHPAPLLPGRVVRERVFRIAVPLSFFFWIVQSGTVNYLPLYFQVVKGASAVDAGMLLLPMSLSSLLAYAISGNAVSRWGRYRPFPIIGAVLIIVGLALCIVLRRDASGLAYGAALVVMGLGFGLISQIAMVCAQSAAAYEDVGVVTSGVVFFRNMGSAFGAALFGAVLNRRLLDHLAHKMADGEFTAAESERIRAGQPLTTAALDPVARNNYISGYERAVEDMFFTGLAVSVLVLVLAIALPAIALRRTMTMTGARKDTPAIPSLPVGDAHVREALEDLTRNGLLPVRQRAEAHAERLGISLEDLWLLCLVAHDGTVDTGHLADVMDVAPKELEAGLRSLRSEGLLYAGARAAGPTPSGRELLEDLTGVLRTTLEIQAPRRRARAGRAAQVDLRPYVSEILAEGSAFRPRPGPL